MKRPVLIIYWVFIFTGGFAAYYGLTHENQFLAGFGLLGVGIGLILIGINDIVTRESVEQDEVGNVTTYRGWSAIFGGVLWVVLGIAVFICAIAVLLGQQKPLLHWITLHPGIGLVGLGLDLMAYGSHDLLGAEEERSSALSYLGSLPGRIFAFFLILIGLALVAAGTVEILFPAIFQSGIVAVQTWLKDLKCQVNPIYCGE
jgi:hypothetical protein